jgi:toxin ParE1/3/4
MNIVWSPDAVQDLAELSEHIAEDNFRAAALLVQRIVDLVETLLPTQPAMGRPGRVAGTRELVIARTPYIVPYRVVEARIEIIRVYHSARRWPDRFW